jgi:hypothetical protein
MNLDYFNDEQLRADIRRMRSILARPNLSTKRTEHLFDLIAEVERELDRRSRD